MEPGTRKQLERKVLLHQEILNTLQVLRLTGNQYKPSTLKVIARFKNSVPRIRTLLKRRKLQKRSALNSYTWWDVLTVTCLMYLLVMTLVYLVGQYISRLFQKCSWVLGQVIIFHMIWAVIFHMIWALIVFLQVLLGSSTSSPLLHPLWSIIQQLVKVFRMWNGVNLELLGTESR